MQYIYDVGIVEKINFESEILFNVTGWVKLDYNWNFYVINTS